MNLGEVKVDENTCFQRSIYISCIILIVQLNKHQVCLSAQSTESLRGCKAVTISAYASSFLSFCMFQVFDDLHFCIRTPILLSFLLSFQFLFFKLHCFLVSRRERRELHLNCAMHTCTSLNFGIST